MIVMLAVLGFIGVVFGFRFLRGLIALGSLLFGLYIVMGLYQITHKNDAQPAPYLVDTDRPCQPPTKEDGPWNKYRRPPWCKMPVAAAAPATVAAPAIPAPVATAPSSPAKAWEILPWPPGSADDLDQPSAAAQGLLDRLNRTQLR